jgi:hypothetical protein
MWNALDGAARLSAEASAKALEGIIAGLEAFKLAETEGVAARNRQLEAAAVKLDEAQNDMSRAIDELKLRAVSC